MASDYRNTKQSPPDRSPYKVGRDYTGRFVESGTAQKEAKALRVEKSMQKASEKTGAFEKRAK